MIQGYLSVVLFWWFIIGNFLALKNWMGNDCDELSRIKARVLFSSATLPFLVMVIAKSGQITFFEAVALLIYVCILRKALFDLWEYYSPLP